LEIDRSTQTNLISKKNVNAGSNTKTSEYKVKQIAFDVFPSPLMIAVIPKVPQERSGYKTRLVELWFASASASL